MPAISNLGRSLPGGVSAPELAPPGSGKRFREAGVISPPVTLAGLFSAVAAAALAPSPFCWACWAHIGKANRTLTATVAHHLRMIRLPQLSVADRNSFGPRCSAASNAATHSLALIAAD